uniref:Uncharacterized protein n=1 Tax=Sphaerodactylus townsendi TaxID=933632 RepID=A0ACB8E8I5_9SAUR
MLFYIPCIVLRELDRDPPAGLSLLSENLSDYPHHKANDPCVTIKYKGAHFGSLTAKRHEFKPREGPGPADYDVNQESAVYYENINIKKEGLKIYDLCIPRYHEIMVLQSEKKNNLLSFPTLNFKQLINSLVAHEDKTEDKTRI